jgi:glycosyltransferase involved in cell wall biosynthesis
VSPRRLRLLYLAPDPALTLDQKGGAGTHMSGTIESLRRQGVDVEAFVGSPPGPSGVLTIAQRPAPTLRRAVPGPIRVLARDLRLLAHARAFRRAAYPPFDCVYERSGYLLDVGRVLALDHHVPYFVETDGILVAARGAAYGAALSRLGERLERKKIAAADVVVVMSQASRDDVIRRYGVSEERVVVKGLGVERELLDNPPTGEPVFDVGWAGTFQPYHGLDLLVDALRQVETRSALLVGDGPGRPGIEAAIHGLPVELPGLLPRAEALARLAECRVLVIPDSDVNVYPMKLLEYGALGRPIVCPRQPAFEEFRDHGDELLVLFAPGDARDLARAIDEAGGPGARERALLFRELVARRYTWDSAAARLVEKLQSVAGSAAEPGSTAV